MKSKSFFFLIVFIIFLSIGGLFWMFNVDESKLVKPKVKVANTFLGLSKRLYKTLKIKDSFALNEITYDLFTIGEKIYAISGEQELSLTLLDTNFNVSKSFSVEGYSISKYNISGNKKSFLFKNNTEDKSSVYLLENDVLNLMYKNLPFDFTAQFNDSLYFYFGNRIDSLYLQSYNVLSKRSDSISLSNAYENTSKNLGFVLNGNLLAFNDYLYHFPMNCAYGFKLNIKKPSITSFTTLDSIKIPLFKEVYLSEGVKAFSVEPEIFVNIKQVVYKNHLANLSYITKPVNGKIQTNAGAVIDVYDLSLNYTTSWELPAHQNKHNPISFCFSKDEKWLYVLYDDNKLVNVFELND